MPIKIDSKLTSKKLVPQIEHVFELSGQKILSIEKSWKPEQGTPVFTVKGKYISRGWTEWTQGFQYVRRCCNSTRWVMSDFWRSAKRGTVQYMASHVSHIGVHDHGSTTSPPMAICCG